MARIRSFTPKFREETVGLVRESNRPITHVAKELDDNAETLRSWVRRSEPDEQPGDADLSINKRPGCGNWNDAATGRLPRPVRPCPSHVTPDQADRLRARIQATLQ